MAHYAKLGLNNIVTAVVAVDTIDCMTTGGIEKEEIGLAHLVKHHGHELWKKCSYNTRGGEHSGGGTPFRANYPGIGWYYNSEHDIFHPARPYASYTLNTTTGMWEAPLPQPELTEAQVEAGSYYRWNEDAYQADNTAGWVLETRDAE